MRNNNLSIPLFVFLCLAAFVCAASGGYALELGKVKAAFLAGDYKAAIKEGEKVMEETEETPGIDELYYLLGVSYFKDGNYLRASDIFEIIINEFKDSAYTQEARLGLADTYYMRGFADEARKRYEEFSRDPAFEPTLDQVYYRLSMLCAKTGDTLAAQEYKSKIKDPAVFSSGMFNEMNTVPLFVGYYTVQVGSFAQKGNAVRMQKELQGKGFVVFVESGSAVDPSGPDLYRVKVGKYASKKDADDASARLAELGYPVRVVP